MTQWSSPLSLVQLGEPARVFVSLSLPDARLTHGKDYYTVPLQETPLTFDLLTQRQMDEMQKTVVGRW